MTPRPKIIIYYFIFCYTFLYILWHNLLENVCKFAKICSTFDIVDSAESKQSVIRDSAKCFWNLITTTKLLKNVFTYVIVWYWMHLKSEKKSNLVKKRRQIKNQPNVGGGNDAKVAHKRSAKTQKNLRFTESQKYRKNSAK